MSWFVYSTCGQPQEFNVYEKRPKGDLSTVNKESKGRDGAPLKIRLNGGAYVLGKRDGKVFKVLVTELTDEEMELLRQNDAYCRMRDRGFFTEHKARDMRADAHGNPQDMEKRDDTAQISDADHAAGTDPRVDHASSRATAGLNNQDGGDQPVGSLNGEYGPVYL